MIITTIAGIKVATRSRSTVTFEKILKRWYAVYYLKGTRSKVPCKVPVKKIWCIKAGTL